MPLSDTNQARSLQPSLSPQDFQRLCSVLFDAPVAEVRYTADSEGDVAPDSRRFTLQVIDRLKQDWAGYWLAVVWLAATEGGAPTAEAGFSLAFGTQIAVPLAGRVWLLQTTAAGQLVFDLTEAGAATRHVRCLVLGRIKDSGSFTWAA